MEKTDHGKNKYVAKDIHFTYPDEQGKAKVISFELIAREEDAVKFDQFMKILKVLANAVGVEEIPIYDLKKGGQHE